MSLHNDTNRIELKMVRTNSSNSLHSAHIHRGQKSDGIPSEDGDAIADGAAETSIEVKNPGLYKSPTVVIEDEDDKAMLWNKADALYCFRYLLLFNAALLSYAHGRRRDCNIILLLNRTSFVYIRC